MKVFNNKNRKEWDDIVKSFAVYDVYYLYGYVAPFALHGDGDPMLLYYQSEGLRGICVLMLRDIAQIPIFAERLPQETYFDAITPYGYGGFIFEGETSKEQLDKFYADYIACLKDLKVISVFYRYHPILHNAHILENYSTIIDLGKTIHIDLTTEEDIWDNLLGKNRTTIRKAIKSDVIIEEGKGKELLSEFRSIYSKTMDGDNADEYYYFSPEFYEALNDELSDNYTIFYALKDGQIISIAIILYANSRMHYHLSGSVYEYRSLSPSNLLLYTVACCGAERGFKTFHLGGGVGSGEDPLFKFKQAFNKNSANQFSIGYDIVDPEMYHKLVRLRSEEDPDFNQSSTFFPLYRAQ
ncbi:lipid II:glycine glycyltransferase FemX [Porphyromonas levii]|uniref:lipid II:glycine glycyltransferase FemX n=1 Tax=Porphyromonas levii TaxID=28114 RepID=UPI0003621687|nr:GNAT family N-acetyltransferase [Porphyromonas levii]